MQGLRAIRPAANGNAVQFYERESYPLSDHVGSALSAASAGILIESPRTARGDAAPVCSRPRRRQRQGAGRFVALDARDTLTGFIVDGWPDPARVDDTVGTVIAKTRERAPRVQAFGEVVALLWRREIATRRSVSRSRGTSSRRAEQAAPHRPVLLDIGRPGFDGYEVAGGCARSSD